MLTLLAENLDHYAFLRRQEFYVVVVYLLLMVGIGIFFAKRMKGGEDYFAGGRRIPWWVSGISLYMGNFSAWMFTGGASLIFKSNLFGLLLFFLSGTIGYLLGSQLTAVHWRRARVISPTEFTRSRFGASTQLLLSCVFVLAFIAAAGVQLMAICTVVNQILGVPLTIAAIGIGLFIILYTFLGGLWAVAVTDVVQFVILLGATIVVVPLAIGLTDGGISTIYAKMDHSLFPASANAGYNSPFLIAFLLSAVLGTASGQGPSFYSVPDERSARKVGLLAAALFLTTPLLFSIPPLVARALFGLDLTGDISGANPEERVFIVIVQKVLPVGLVGVFLAAMFAATMSALDSVYNRSASMLSRDVYMHFRPKTSDRTLLNVGKIATLMVGLSTIVMTLYYMGEKSPLFDTMAKIFGVAAGVTSAPLILGLLFRSAPRFAGIASLLWGALIGVTTGMIFGWGYAPQVFTTQAAAAIIFLISRWLGDLWCQANGRISTIIVGMVFGIFTFGLLSSITNVESSFFVYFKDVDGTRSLTWGVLDSFKDAKKALELLFEVRAAYIMWGVSVLIALSVPFFASKFACKEDRAEVEEFYKRLDTPIDVAREVKGVDTAALEVFRLVGVLTYIIAGLIIPLAVIDYIAAPEGQALLQDVLGFLGIQYEYAMNSEPVKAQPYKFLALIAILAALGSFFFFAGVIGKKRAEAKADSEDGATPEDTSNQQPPSGTTEQPPGPDDPAPDSPPKPTDQA